MSHLLSYEDVNQILQESDLDVDPAYLHGVWCGLIVGGEYFPVQDWLNVAFEEPGIWHELTVAAQTLLLRLAEQTITEMSEFSFNFTLLLPEDDAILQDRAYALSEFCVGFVIGVQHQREQQTLLTGEGAHALSDIAKISDMEFGTVECEEEEVSYAELVEFVRIAVLTIHQQLLEGGSLKQVKSPHYLH